MNKTNKKRAKSANIKARDLLVKYVGMFGSLTPILSRPTIMPHTNWDAPTDNPILSIGSGSDQDFVVYLFGFQNFDSGIISIKQLGSSCPEYVYL